MTGPRPAAPGSSLDDDAVVADVRTVVGVVGRGEPGGPASDRATTRLLDRFRDHPAGGVAAVSVLYQAHDATAALIAAMVVAGQAGRPRRSAVAGTVRVADGDTTVAGAGVAAGTVVTLDLEASALEFGAGPHRCPGRAVAEGLAAGVVDALGESGYRLRADLVETGPDGRPRTLPMEVDR
jgi:hypothetical protein